MKNKKDDIKLYKMTLKFKLTLGLRDINRILSALNNDKILIEDAAILRLTQTLPIIPTPKQISEYEKILKENYMKDNPKFSVENCKFDGFEFIEEITKEKDNDIERD